VIRLRQSHVAKQCLAPPPVLPMTMLLPVHQPALLQLVPAASIGILLQLRPEEHVRSTEKVQQTMILKFTCIPVLAVHWLV